MTTKTCLVTGANSGMGLVTAEALARTGARVILLCRSLDKAERACETVARSSGNTDVVPLAADLASQRQIRAAAERFKGQFDRLDVLVNNAGMLAADRTLTEDGIESTFAVNHLGPFLLTNLLREPLERSDAARVVTVASDVHRLARFDPDDLQLERGYGAYKAYCISKLANIMFTFELAKRLASTRVTANCLHPGLVGSSFGRDAKLWFRVLMMVSRPFLVSPEKGAETAIYLATSPEVAAVSGAYFKRCRVASPIPVAHDPAATARLWSISEQLTGATA
ncbi:MAG: SDR family oxidoreductase [Ectothiorhodospiraceae bacterium]|nr:SDR family oxidoreductase [Chromatiales bacterium]MCP5154883.1 SDR family oxidoreductase [Ectothiorhodospiraceae bacterium]